VTRAKREFSMGKDRAEAEGATQMTERQWEFAGYLFRSERDIYRSIVEEWLTSGGLNNERGCAQVIRQQQRRAVGR
jgi:hypothetical protein